MTIEAYPLAWPDGWKRTPPGDRKNAKFRGSKGSVVEGRYRPATEVSIAEGTRRLIHQISAFTPPGRRWVINPDDVIISTNLQLRNDGLPRSGQREPSDPGVCVYWKTDARENRCMAIDIYDRVADNLAAVAATLEAMRAIERHGGAEILSKAFTGFTAIEHEPRRSWSEVLGVPAHGSTEQIREAYKRARGRFHPDRPGGDADNFNEIQKAWEQFCAERGVSA